MELDKDLKARQEARRLAAAAEQAQKVLASMSQQQLDQICQGVAKAFCAAAAELAAMAVRETGCGKVEAKSTKNEIASRKVQAAIRERQTVGV